MVNESDNKFWDEQPRESGAENGDREALDLDTAKRIAIWRPYDRLDYDTAKLIIENSCGRVLCDLGAGYGRIVKAINDNFPGYSIDAVDIDRNMRDRCKEYCRKDLMIWDTAGWEFSDKTYDTIYAIEMFQHINSIDHFIRILSNVTNKTKRGGRLIIIGEQGSSYIDKFKNDFTGEWELIYTDNNCLPKDSFPRLLLVYEKQ